MLLMLLMLDHAGHAANAAHIAPACSCCSCLLMLAIKLLLLMLAQISHACSCCLCCSCLLMLRMIAHVRPCITFNNTNTTVPTPSSGVLSTILLQPVTTGTLLVWLKRSSKKAVALHLMLHMFLIPLMQLKLVHAAQIVQAASAADHERNPCVVPCPIINYQGF